MSDLLNIFAFRPDINLGVFLRNMQSKGLLQILAEPNLVTNNGQMATFLVGGEFPVPVLQGGSNGRSTPFFRLFYQVESLKSGMHHPDGILWMRIPGIRPSVSREKVSLRDLPPTILSMFGIEKPPYMTGRILPVATPAWRT